MEDAESDAIHDETLAVPQVEKSKTQLIKSIVETEDFTAGLSKLLREFVAERFADELLEVKNTWGRNHGLPEEKAKPKKGDDDDDDEPGGKGTAPPNRKKKQKEEEPEDSPSEE